MSAPLAQARALLARLDAAIHSTHWNVSRARKLRSRLREEMDYAERGGGYLPCYLQEWALGIESELYQFERPVWSAAA